MESSFPRGTVKDMSFKLNPLSHDAETLFKTN